jgi:hypothetical protein
MTFDVQPPEDPADLPEDAPAQGVDDETSPEVPEPAEPG